MLLTFKYRLKDRSAKKVLKQHAIACNQVWNFCVATQRETQRRWTAGAATVKWLSQYDLCALTKGTSKELGVHAQTVQSVCERFVAARAKKRGAPRFRASFGSVAARGFVPFLRQSRRIEGNSVTYLGKRFRWFGNKRRPLPETARGGAFVEDALGRWWVFFHVDVAQEPSMANGEIGIDLGLKTLATCSDGHVVQALQHYRRHDLALGKAQCAGNKRRVKAIHARIANCRRDQHHKATTEIVRANSFIAVGDVNPAKLAKTRMAKSVLDAGWSQFRSMLLYKARLRGAEIVVVNEAFSTQACSECGCIGGPKGTAGLRIRNWDCEHCGASHNRDENAARNILNFALSAQRLAEESRRAA